MLMVATELPNVRLLVSSKAENVWLVREMLSGVAEAIDLDDGDLNDIRTAVTEACNNVVMHAYRGEVGPLEVDVRLRRGTLEVAVRDDGIWIHGPGGPDGDARLGLGLPVIHALARSVAIADTSTGGSGVRMEFPITSSHELEQPGDQVLEHIAAAQIEPSPDVEIVVASGHLARTVLPRVFGVLATLANFSTDRISDVQLVMDAIATHAPRLIHGAQLRVAARFEPRNLELWISPLAHGRAQRLLLDPPVEDLGAMLRRLADQRRVAPAGSAETLALRLVDSRR
jgi:serine/threonine-protein kinase RsbW